MADPYNLHRFVDAQEAVIEQVRDELRKGRKTTHWMWFVFPQIAGLGQSRTSVAFAINSLAEARAYLAHPLLGPRLREFSRLLLAVQDRPIHEILGPVDATKLRSCMTLFAQATEDDADFNAILEKYFEGKPDSLTLRLLTNRGEE